MLYTKLTKTQLKEWLFSWDLTVVFIKLNGMERVCHCTLRPKELDKHPSTGTGKHQAEETVSVWDLDKQDWRSFRIDSVISVEYYLGEKNA